MLHGVFFLSRRTAAIAAQASRRCSLVLAVLVAAGALAGAASVPAAPAVAQPGQAALIQELENIDGFLHAPVDPQTFNPLPGDPYANTLGVLDPYLSQVESEASGGGTLTSAQLSELENVVNVLNLVVGNVSTTGAQTPLSIAQANADTTSGQWGISYEVALIIGQRAVDAASNVAQIAEDLITDPIGDYIESSADGFLIDFTNDVPIQLDSILSHEVSIATDVGLSDLSNILGNLFSDALKLQAIGADDAHSIADWLTSFSGYEIDLFLAGAVQEAAVTTTTPPAGTVSGILQALSGPANTALETYDELQANFTNGPIQSLISLLGVLPVIGGTVTITDSLAAIGGDIGGNLVDLNYLYDPIGIPDPKLLTYTLMDGWTSGENNLLPTAVTVENGTPTAATLSVDSSASGCSTVSGVTQCELGALIGFSGTVTGSSGSVADAQVDVTATDGTVTSPSLTTDSAGNFTGGLIMPTSVGETVTITASVPGTSVTQQAEVTVGPGSPYAVKITGPSVFSAGTTSIPVAGILTDYYDNGISGTTVDLSSSAGSVSPATTTTSSGGTFQATVTVPADTTSVTVTASIPGTFLTNSITPQSATAPSLTLGTPSVSGLTCTINGSAQATTSGATISSVLWQWGDGTTTTSTAFPQSHTYSATGTDTVTVTATDSDGDTATQTATCDVSAPAGLKITTSTLPTASTGTPYTAAIGISGGTPPYTFSWSGALPAGLYFYAPPTLSGTPEQAGVYSFPVTVTDSSSPPQKVKQTVTITVQAPGNPVIATTTLPNGTLGQPYSATIQITGGAPPYTVDYTPLPPGLSFNSSSDSLTGTPTTPGQYQFTITVVDSNKNTASQSYNLTIGNPGSVGSGSFVEQLAAPQGVVLTAIQCMPDNATTDCWAVGHSGDDGVIYHSTNAGQTWTAENVPSGYGGGAWGIDCPAVNTCYATGGNGVIATTDGSTWSVISTAAGVSEDAGWTTSISCPSVTTCFITAGSAYGSPETIYATTDAWATWNVIDTCASCTGGVTGTTQFNESGISCPTTSNCYSAGYLSQSGNDSAGVLSTADGGATWNTQGSGFSGATALEAITCTGPAQCWVDGLPNTAGLPTYPFVASTQDGSTWQSFAPPSTAGVGGTVAGSVSCVSATSCVALNANTQDAFVTVNGGSGWSTDALPAGASGQLSAVSCIPSGQCWVTTSGGDILATSLTGSPPADSPTQLAFTSAPVTGYAGFGTTIGPVTITEEDANGTPAAAPYGGTAIALSSSSPGGQFSATPGGPATTAITIPAGATSATVYYSDLAAGTPVITASSGLLLSAQQQQTVQQAVPAVEIRSVTTNPVAGEPITVDVAVTSPDSGPGLPTPTGDAVVSDGTHTCKAPLTGSAGQATGSCSITEAHAGTYPFSATYPGDSVFGPNSASQPTQVTVAAASSSVTLTLSQATVTFGAEQGETFTVTVHPEYTGTPAGKVIIKSGATKLCTVTVAAGTGTCSPKPSALAVGTHTVVAHYEGSADFKPSQSQGKRLAVTAGSAT